MAFVEEIEDDQFRLLARLISTHDAYRLSDGTQRWIATRAAWCVRCRQFVNVERLDCPEELEQKARKFYESEMGSPLIADDIIPPEEYRAMCEKLLRNALREAEQWRVVLARRKSPPRCLECGGTEFQEIPEDGSWSVHPGNPNRRVRNRNSVIHASMSNRGRLYSIEGKRLLFRYAAI